MKKHVFYFSYYMCAVLSAVFAIFHIYGLFSMIQLPSLNDAIVDRVTFPRFAQLRWIFIIAALVLLAAFFFLDFIGQKKSYLSKGMLVLLKDKMSLTNVFIFFSAAVTFLSLIFIIAHKEVIWGYFLPEKGMPDYDSFMDFFNHISYSRDPSKVYFQSVHACFPPLAYVFYYAISLILPSDATIMYNAVDTQYSALIVYIVYFVLCVVAFAFLMMAIMKKLKLNYTVTVIFLLLSSNIFIFEVLERGNSVLIVTLLLLAAIWLKDSPKAYCREIALICIAVAAGFKVYPALFGFMYLREKRIKEGFRLLIYGIIFFFLPFAFFGGFEGLLQFFRNQSQVQGGSYAFVYSIKSTVRYISALIYQGDVHRLDLLASASQILFILVNFACFFNKRLSSWERAFLLCSIMAFGPAWSGGYTSIFFTVPLAILLGDCSLSVATNRKYRNKNTYLTLVAILFAFTFCLNMFVLPNGIALKNFGCIPLYIINLMILGNIACKAFFDFRAKLLEKRATML